MIRRVFFVICIFFISVSWAQCPLSTSVLPVSCAGGSDGEITITPAVAGYWVYELQIWNTTVNMWMPFGTANTSLPSFTFSVPSDSFRVLVDDNILSTPPSNCFSSGVFVPEPPPLQVNSLANNESAPGACDGAINLIISGGTPPYSYAWNGPSGFSANTQNITNLCAGVYNLTLTDNNGCVFNLSDMVSSPTICDINAIVVNSVTCPSGNDGSALITNGAATFQFFSWDNLSNGLNYGNGPVTAVSTLEAGWYTITGTDITGTCPNTVSNSFQITEPTPFIQSAQSVCIGDSVQLSVDVQDPSAGVSYFFSVNGNANTYSVGTTSLEYLQAGNHFYTLFADTGTGLFSCGTNVPFSITGITSLSISIDSTLETCRGNEASITIHALGSGGLLSYSIDGGNTFFPDSVFLNLTNGMYNVFVQELGGCTQPYTNNPISIGVTPINYVVDSIKIVEESCCGNDGQIRIFTSGSDTVLLYSADSMYSWQNTALFSNLTAGNYFVFVEDTNGCRTNSGNVNITAVSIPNIDMTVHKTDLVCHGDSSGTLRVIFPDNCYSYSLWRYTISPPYYIPVDSGTYFNGLIPGSYGVIGVSNSGNCIDSSLAIVVQEPASLVQNNIATQAVRCANNGICNGEIALDITPSGGVPPYYYSVLEFATNIPFGPKSWDSAFVGLCANTYLVSLFDANACLVVDTVVVADSTLQIDSLLSANVTCFNYANGLASVYAHGGYLPYIYLWSNGDSTLQVDSLDNGIYYVTITDTTGCYAKDTVTISQPNDLLFNIAVVNGYQLETCKGVSHDGAFYMHYQGGTAPYWWSWTGSSGASATGMGDTIPNLTYDTLTITVVDANGCIGKPAWIHADSARVDALNALNPLVLDTIVADSVLCFGTATASIFIDVKRGEKDYTYSIDGGTNFFNDSIFNNLSSGTYPIEVRDVFGCAVYDTISISQATEIVITNDSIKHVSCYQGTDGYLSVVSSGGYSPYSFLWNPTLVANNEANNLSAGTHSVTVQDNMGCVQKDTFVVVELTLPLLSEITILNQATCFLSEDASATISIVGGMPPYSIDWGGVNNNALAAGTYLVVINDSFNCGPIYDTVVILQPDQLLVQASSIKHNPCFGDAKGEVALTAFGGTMPYANYYAADQNGNVVISNTPWVSGLLASEYQLWVVDAEGCFSDTIQSVKVGEPGELEIVSNQIDATCFRADDGILQWAISSGTSPYLYQLVWNNTIIKQGIVNPFSWSLSDSLSAATYFLQVVDSNQCIKDSVFVITEPNEVVADFSSNDFSIRENFTVQLQNNSQGADVFYWNYGDGSQETITTNQSVKHLYNKQGQFEIMLIAENAALSKNCNDTALHIVDIQGFDVFNVFSPNNDGLNDVFSFEDWDLFTLYVEIYNRWGEKVYHWDNPQESWDGKAYNGDKVPDGVYYFYLKAQGADGFYYEQQGSITVIR